MLYWLGARKAQRIKHSFDINYTFTISSSHSGEVCICEDLSSFPFHIIAYIFLCGLAEVSGYQREILALVQGIFHL